MIKRPTSKETEDDLLRMQEEFAKDPSTKPSAAVIKNRPPTKKVSFQVEDRSVETVSAPVLSEIREKNLDVREFHFRPPKSIAFAKPVKDSGALDESSCSPSICPSSSLTHEDQPADIESMKRDVHLENVNRLAGMSHEEILKERQELLKRCDPKMIEFLKRRREQKATVEPGQTVEAKKLAPTQVDNQASDRPVLPLDEFPVKPTQQWLHMDQPEPEKMAWMGALPEASPPQEFCSARFDFKGHLVSRNVDVSVADGLHHHGEEPEAPGYTVNELLRLCRVQALNQRVLALNTLANIVRLAKSGFYDNLLKPPSLLKSLLESNICTIMRYALDDNAESGISATCHLLASFLHSSLDEACLDIGYGLSIDTSQLFLAPTDDEDGDSLSRLENDEDMDDEAFCNKDMILGLLRMGILERLRYILEVLEPRSGRCIMDIFTVLIRIARHSCKACAQIFDCPRLMDALLAQFLPTAWQTKGFESDFYPTYKKPYWGAVKLCRIMASSKRELAFAVVDRYNVGDMIIRYIITEPEEMMIPLPEACQVIVESYRLWGQLLTYDLRGEYFSDLFETMTLHLRAAVTTRPSESRRNFQWDRAAALALTVTKFVKMSRGTDATGQPQLAGIADVIVMALMKFLQEGKADADVSYYYLVASLANCVSEAVSSKWLQLDKKRLEVVVNDLVPRFQSSIGNRFTQDATPPATAAVRLSARDPSCLPSLESVGGETLITILRDGSLYPLVMALRRLCRSVSDTRVQKDVME